MTDTPDFEVGLHVLTRRLQLATLWLAIFLNMLFRDIHQFGSPGYIDEMANMDVPEPLFLVAGIVISINIAMVPLNALLPTNWLRWTNFGVGILMLASIVSILPGDMDDWWFWAVELVLLSLIGWKARTFVGTES